MYKSLAGLFAAVMLFACMTGCSSDDEGDDKGTVDVFPDNVDISTPDNKHENGHKIKSDTEASSEESLVNPPKGLIKLDVLTADEIEAVQEAVDNALTAEKNGDEDNIIKYAAMEYYYFTQHRHSSTSDEELKKFLKDSRNRYMTTPYEGEELYWDINVYSLDDEYVSDMKDYIEVKLPAGIMEEKAKAMKHPQGRDGETASRSSEEPVYIPTLEELYSAYDIDNICAVDIITHYPETGDESSLLAYAFKINGEWKLDFMYTQSYYIYSNFESNGNEEDDPC